MITSAGYRIGPGEVEESLMRHPEVSLAAVVGVPDPIRTEIVKAFVVLKGGSTASDALAREIQEFVKARVAAHQYPRAIEFVDSLPMTATGKIKRGELKARELPPRSEFLLSKIFGTYAAFSNFHHFRDTTAVAARRCGFKVGHRPESPVYSPAASPSATSALSVTTR